jgi:hypothetical protein
MLSSLYLSFQEIAMPKEYQNFENRVRQIFKQKTSLALSAFFRPGYFAPHFSTRYAPQLALYEAVSTLSEAEQNQILSVLPDGLKLSELFSLSRPTSLRLRKVFNETQNIGRAKYVVNYHNGEKTHGDGSPFFDIAIFSNKRKKSRFVRGLRREGYKQE